MFHTIFLSKWKRRSSRPEVFCKKGVLKNFEKFTGKQLCLSQHISCHWSPSIPPWRHQQTSGFLISSGGIGKDQWHEMG